MVLKWTPNESGSISIGPQDKACLWRVECGRDTAAPHQWPRFRDVNFRDSPGHLLCALALVATTLSPGHDNSPLPPQMRTPLWSTHSTPGVLI